MKIAAYVRSKDGKPLDPMHSYPRVKKFLRDGKAIIVSHKPFVIQLTYDIKNPITDTYHLGNDTGRTNLGISIIEEKGKIAYSAYVETCNKDVPDNMTNRANHRRVSRCGERKVRQRLAIKHGTTFQDGPTRKRILPNCVKPIENKFIINSEARFSNRKRLVGRLTPTARHLLNTYLKAIDMACDLLPIKDITIEITRWDFAKMQNPGIKNWEYAKGALFGFDSVNDAVSHRQDHKCLMCGGSIDAYHHVIPKHLGGSDSVDNLAGLCTSCHNKVHTDVEFEAKLKSQQNGKLKELHALSVMNQIMPYLLKELVKRHPDKKIYVTTGKETSKLRKKFGLQKKIGKQDAHWIDAWCIAASRINTNAIAPSTITTIARMEPYRIKQFRHNNRAIINHQTERTYKIGNKPVAKNRHKRFEQKGDSLEDWFNKMVAKYGVKQAEKMRSQLKVQKSTRYYNTPGRLMPGAVFLFEGKRYVMSGQRNKGAYLLAVGHGDRNFPTKKCKIIRRNSGLVYL